MKKTNWKKNQIEPTRTVIGSTKLISISNVYEESRWETLSARRKQHRLKLFYKMIYYLTPPYLSSFVSPLVEDISRYNLRNSDQFQTLECKSQLYYNSFLPAVV